MIGSGQNDCLRRVQHDAERMSDWSEFAAYCRHRESGLRKQAFESLSRFILVAKQWPFSERKRFVDWLCNSLSLFRSSDGYGLAPQPLIMQVIQPTLEEWIKQDVLDSTPCRWAGMFFSHVAYGPLRAGLAESTPVATAHLREALRRNPSDNMARIRLVELILGDVEYSCHHLPEYYLGNPSDDLMLLNEVRDLIFDITQPDQDRLRSELDQVNMLVKDWINCQTEKIKDFRQWCAEHGRNYHWCHAYYYSK